ncbi:MAG TPA: hypothetical protein VGF99_20380, partial [Myxococcota bacterium]
MYAIMLRFVVATTFVLACSTSFAAPSGAVGTGVAGARERAQTRDAEIRAARDGDTAVILEEHVITIDDDAQGEAIAVERSRRRTRFARPPSKVFNHRLRAGESLGLQFTTRSGRTIDVAEQTILAGTSDDGTVSVDIVRLAAPDAIATLLVTTTRRHPFPRAYGAIRTLGSSIATEVATVTVDADAAIGVRLQLHNSTAQVVHEQRGTRQRSTISLRDLAAAPQEGSSPDRRLQLPWWTLDRGGDDRWARALGLYPGLLDTAAAGPSPVSVPKQTTCGADRRCRLDAVVRAVLDAVEIVPGNDVRAPVEAHAAGRVTPLEGAVMVWRALRDIGEEANIAVSSSFPNVPLVAGVGARDDIDRWLVVVDRAGAAPLWIDPACRSCRVGELRAAQLDR